MTDLEHAQALFYYGVRDTPHGSEAVQLGPTVEQVANALGEARRRALRDALPAEPPGDFMFGCWEDGMSDGQAREAWRLVRIHLLGEDA